MANLDDCPDNPALGGTIDIDFSKGASSQFKSLSTPIKYTPEGALFTITSDADSPTIEMYKYIMFGRVDIKMQASPGAGIVTSLVLESKDLDEIDLVCIIAWHPSFSCFQRLLIS